MDYKKEYEAMVQRARELHEGGNALTKLQMEIVCPELAESESEDEKIRKEIRNFLIDMECKGEWIAYLEKQKVNTDGDFARGYDCGYQCCLNSHGAEWFEKQKEQKPTEWSEEDERIRGHIIDALTYYAENHSALTVAFINRDIDWLKSLCPQHHWKPSEEQMEALNTLLCTGDFSYVGQHPQIQGLYNDLKKL